MKVTQGELNKSEPIVVREPRTMGKPVKCNDCGHEGDLHESVYFTGRTDQFKFALQCSQCNSHDMIVVSKQREDDNGN